MSKRKINIHVPVLTRVEGEGALHLKIEQGKIEQLQLSIYEPPRYFEKFLEGRSHQEILDIVARICGICPVAYQMSAVQAIENAFAVKVSETTEQLRRVFYCGEWIQSHALHIHLLAAPDFLGFSNGIEMAKQYPDEVKRGLALQNIGNRLIRLFGARSVHPIGVCAGGFYHLPSKEEVQSLLDDLYKALPQAEALLQWTATLPLVEDEQEFISVAMRHEHDYPMYSGRLVSSEGLDIAISKFAEHFQESHEAHSTALFSHLHGKPYLVGPLARLNLNMDRLSKTVRKALQKTGIHFPSPNMFHSVIARAVEILLALHEAIRLLANYQKPTRTYVEVSPQAGIGFGCSEAPRGLLWHRYAFDSNGQVKSAQIVPPTSQNQARVEEDLHQSLLNLGLDKDDETLRLHSEMVIRNYDPCISCATHFLKLNIER